MCENLFNTSELKFLWKRRGNKNYDLKTFISNGTFIQYMMFEDLQNRRKVMGKIVTSPREGEAYHWPRLQHENLAPLIDIVAINEKISIYLLPLTGRNLRNVIHEKDFIAHPDSFDRKKAYTEDILWALDYLHEKSLCLMNLTELIIYICDISDKAMICDFSCVRLIERADKESIDLPTLYQAPELKSEYFDPVAAETWACGVMLLQIFTRHTLPSAFIGAEVHQVLRAVEEISYNIIKETNPGAQIDFSVIEDLRSFLGLFLVEDPKNRVNARSAAVSPFLRYSRRLSVKDYNNRQLLESNKHFDHHSASHKSKWIDLYPENRKNSATFKDIYQEEIASCRNKLKKLPCMNKFINLDFVPDGDRVSKYPDNYSIDKELSDDFKGDGDRKKATLEHSHCSELRFDDNPAESLIDDNMIFYTPPKAMKNETCLNCDINANISNLERIPNYLEDITENTVKQEDSENNDCEIQSSINKTNDFDNEKEHPALKPQSSSNADVSASGYRSDSESEHSFHSLLLDLTLWSNKKSSRSNEKIKNENFSTPRSITPFFTKSIRSNSEIIESNSNLGTNTAVGLNTSNIRHSRWSDPCMNLLTNSKDNTTDFDLSASTFSSIRCNENYSRKITIFDSTKLAEESVNSSYDYNWLSHGIKKSPNERQSIEMLKPQLKHLAKFAILKDSTLDDKGNQNDKNRESQKDSPNGVILQPQTDNAEDDLDNNTEFTETTVHSASTPQNQSNYKLKDSPNGVIPQPQTDNVGDDRDKTDKSTGVSETAVNPVNSLHNQVNFILNRRVSYKHAIAHGFTKTTKIGADTIMKDDNFKTGKKRSLLKILFSNRKTSTMKEKTEKNSNDKSKKECILSVRDILTNDDNAVIDYRHIPDSMEAYLLSKATKGGIEKIKKKKRTWINCLCLTR